MSMLQVTVLGGLVQNKIIRDFYSSKNCLQAGFKFGRQGVQYFHQGVVIIKKPLLTNYTYFSIRAICAVAPFFLSLLVVKARSWGGEEEDKR